MKKHSWLFFVGFLKKKKNEVSKVMNKMLKKIKGSVVSVSEACWLIAHKIQPFVVCECLDI